jgi:lipoate-protein ligase B
MKFIHIHDICFRISETKSRSEKLRSDERTRYRTMNYLPPILYHRFAVPLPYTPTLALQHKLHQYQLSRRRESQNHPDLLLLLEHRPVYTGGRRQKSEELEEERKRLEGLGADWVATDRGGQTTYHGPGQITGYPLLDLGRMGVCYLARVVDRVK